MIRLNNSPRHAVAAIATALSLAIAGPVFAEDAAAVVQTPSEADVIKDITGTFGGVPSFVKQFPKLPPAPIETSEALEQLRALWHGHRIVAHISDHAPGPGVDTPEDLERVRRLLAA